MKLRYAALCETVLQDIQQRWSLIGIYTGDVIVSQFPTKIRCALYIEFSAPASGPLNLEILLGGRLLANIAAEIGPKPEDGAGAAAVLGIPGIELGLDRPAELKVSWIDGSSKKMVLKKAIVLGNVPQ
jgi:hypothetical protein